MVAVPDATVAPPENIDPSGQTIANVAATEPSTDPPTTTGIDTAALAGSVNSEVEKSSAAIDSQMASSEPGSEQIERLKAALDADAEQVREPSRQSTTYDVRARVDSLLQRSRNLFDLGHLREARHTAKIAHDLGDSASLDYPPDQERPIDLVQRIDDQLKSADGQAADQVAEGTTPDVMMGDPLDKSIAPPRPAAVADTETSAKSRLDWGLSVFRRDRKNQAAAAAAPEPVAAATVVAPPAVRLGLEADTEESDQAVVQANRSTTLLGAASSDVTEPAESETVTPTSLLPPQRSIEQDAKSGSSLFEDGSGRETNLQQPLMALELSDAPERLVIEETALPPAEFDEVRPLRPFRDVARNSHSESNISERIEQAPSFHWNWIFGLTMFAICSGFAWSWYRRGAT